MAPVQVRRYVSIGFVSFGITGLMLAAAGHLLLPNTGVATVEYENNVVASLYEQHHCWGNDGRAHPAPGHVIYDGRLWGRHMTGLVLDQMFAHVDNGLDLSKVAAYCP